MMIRHFILARILVQVTKMTTTVADYVVPEAGIVLREMRFVVIFVAVFVALCADLISLILFQV